MHPEQTSNSDAFLELLVDSTPVQMAAPHGMDVDSTEVYLRPLLHYPPTLVRDEW